MSVLVQLRSTALAVERSMTSAAVAAAALLLAAAVLVGVYQVIARFILFRPASWSEPVVQGALIWMAYLALAGAMRAGSLISVDILLRVTRGPLRSWVRTVGITAIVVLLGILIWFGTILCWRVRFQNLAGLNMAASYVYAALPVGALFSMVALVGRILDPPGETAEQPDTSA